MYCCTMTIDDDQFSEGVRAAAMHLWTSIRGAGVLATLDSFVQALTRELEPEFLKGLSKEEFQKNAETALEKMFNQIPDNERIGTEYRKSDKEFIKEEEEEVEKKPAKRVLKTPRKALGMKPIAKKPKF